MDLVIYYSRTNNTREVSELIAKEKGCETLEIKDKQNRTGIGGFIKGIVDSVSSKETGITYDTVNLSDYDTIYIGTPVWASKPAPAVIEYIEENDFTDCNVVTFATFMGSGGESTTNAMNKAVKAKGGNITRSFAFRMTGNDKKELVLEALNDN